MIISFGDYMNSLFIIILNIIYLFILTGLWTPLGISEANLAQVAEEANLWLFAQAATPRTRLVDGEYLFILTTITLFFLGAYYLLSFILFFQRERKANKISIRCVGAGPILCHVPCRTGVPEDQDW